MVADLKNLIQEPKFLFKLFDFICCFTALLKLLELKCFTPTFVNLIIYMAVGGGILAMAFLIAMYVFEEKSDKLEMMLLVTYGLMNLIASYYLYKKMKPCALEPTFNRKTILVVSTALAGVAMIADAIKSGAVGGNGGGAE